jgi:hypothetical protein
MTTPDFTWAKQKYARQVELRSRERIFVYPPDDGLDVSIMEWIKEEVDFAVECCCNYFEESDPRNPYHHSRITPEIALRMRREKGLVLHENDPSRSPNRWHFRFENV